MKNNLKKNKKGFIAIESLLPTITILLLFIFIIQYFLHLYPRISLQVEAHTLTQKAKVQGGLTPLDIENMKLSLSQKGFKSNQIFITAKTESGKDVTNVTPLGSEGTNYVRRDSNDEMTITIKVPADSGLKSFMAMFNKDATISNENHVITETIYSERW